MNKRSRATTGDDPAAGAPAPARRDTRQRILEAAYQRLAREGYAALSVREIARDAGVNFALINYHFESKDKLVIAVLDEANRRLLDRQERMYRAPGGYADKWAQARRFFENDLASGFVRVLMELYAASMSNEALRNEFRPRLTAWYEVVAQATREAVAQHRPDLPVDAEVIACWICNFWIGMEMAMLTGMLAPEVHARALDGMELLLRKLDAGTPARADEAPAPRKPRARSPRRGA
ncbi:TetR/AcrR family transcriptional regulator [Ramlibacter sp. USB13]|uniref:TetR/AcrR family transcriptional regulator n=1 Tax=Ramlibacter cellulosilyticus TaxID=2764187 RepID=A0A923MPC8_9BURK|nr:TetR family transcriptional regulator [Ramlibacter cellulosilyticus]MBC5782388.1 TetR/AcrR family transcriptional regulator [Ramlibacter cellulosilyticus]